MPKKECTKACTTLRLVMQRMTIPLPVAMIIWKTDEALVGLLHGLMVFMTQARVLLAGVDNINVIQILKSHKFSQHGS